MQKQNTEFPRVGTSDQNTLALLINDLLQFKFGAAASKPKKNQGKSSGIKGAEKNIIDKLFMK